MHIHKLQCNAAPNAYALWVYISCIGGEQHPLPRYQACALYIYTSCNVKTDKGFAISSACTPYIRISCNACRYDTEWPLYSMHTHKLQPFSDMVQNWLQFLCSVRMHELQHWQCSRHTLNDVVFCSIHTHKLQLYITQVCRASAWILYAEFQLTFVRLPYRVYLQPNTFGLTHTVSV